MAKQVLWTRDVLEFFIEVACLTELEENVMRTRVKEWPVSKMSMEFHVSESTIHRTIKRLKTKYDQAQREYPDRLPVRRNSAKETYMDTH